MTGYTHKPAFASGTLPVSDIHILHYEQYGNLDGKPVVFLHGGPGGATSPGNTAFFDPKAYRVVLFDQRGSGKSTPTSEIKQNTTQDLVSDIEVLRKHLKFDKWHMVFGGSWGSTLALLYAQAHPDRVSSLVLRGIFLFRKVELDWGHPITGGAAQIFPDVAEDFLQHFTEEEKEDWEVAIYQRLTSAEKPVRVKAAHALNTFDFKRSTIIFDPKSLELLMDEQWSLHHATLLMHYMVHNGFIREGQILEEAEMAKIRHIPCVIVQGRYDIVCPPEAAWELHKAWPAAKFSMVTSGHSATEPETFKELVKACDELAKM